MFFPIGMVGGGSTTASIASGSIPKFTCICQIAIATECSLVARVPDFRRYQLPGLDYHFSYLELKPIAFSIFIASQAPIAMVVVVLLFLQYK